MCRGIGTFPWVPGYPPPHPAAAHAAATASLFSSPGLQHQLDLYYRQVAATQAAAAAQALHQQQGPSSPNSSCPTNTIPSLQIPSPAHLYQHNLNYKLMPSMLPLVSSPTTSLSLSPSKSGKGISAQSSPFPQNHDGSSPSPPPSTVTTLNPTQISKTHLPFSTNSSLDVVSKLPPTTLRPVSAIMPNSIVGSISAPSASNSTPAVNNSTITTANGTSSVTKMNHQLTPTIPFEAKVSSLNS